MSTDYEKQKVPDLKKLLAERGLVVSGNKGDLIARLQEDDKKKPSTGAASSKPAAAEDEIDWDEDDNKPATEAAAATIAAGGKGPVDNPVAVPNQKVAVDPSTTADLKVVAPTPEPTKEPVAAEPKAPAPDFSIGIGETDAEKEAKKRADRAKRFGIPEDEEAKKLAERAKKFGVEAPPVVKGLDAALPDRRPKRVREDKQGGRNAKRQTPDRRTEAPVKTAVAPAKKASGRITDDPVERKKAEERAKRFASTT